MTLSGITSIYTNPLNLGQYPNAHITYTGDKIFQDKKLCIFKFSLISENEHTLEDFYWAFEGDTLSGNTIQDEGEIILSANTSGATTTDFITATLDGVDYDNPLHQVTRLPKLSYDDINTYFILGGKKDKVSLPVGANPRKLIKWLFLNSLYLNGELLKQQFTFTT